MLQFLGDYLLLLEQPWFFYLNLSLGGMLAGSFCTSLIYRLPLLVDPALGGYAKLSLALPGSHCPACRAAIPGYLNLPLVGYLLLRGKCAKCQVPLAWYYPVAEVMCLLAALVAGWFYGPVPQLLPIILLLWALIALTIIDIRSGLLPDLLTLGILWCGLLLNPWLPYASLAQSIWGAAIAYSSLTLVNFCYYQLRQQAGLGGGDIKLFAGLAAYFGWQGFLPLLLIASCSGLLYFLAAALWQKCLGTAAVRLDLKQEQIWGPHIALAVLIYLGMSYNTYNVW